MKYALLFPGQGSQSVGMLQPLAAVQPQVHDTFDEASAALGWDVRKLVDEGPAEDLNRTEQTQPVLLAAGVAVWRAWRARATPAPTLLAGHSLGEYTALVCAGALDFADALKLVELRGRLMQEAGGGEGGGMAALLGMDEAAVTALCAAAPQGEMLEPANFNAPGQIVVAASTSALAWLHEHGKEHGARKVVELAMSVPSHCSLMRSAAERLAERLAEVAVRAPEIPVLHNLDAQTHADADAIRAALAEQLYRPVRWAQTVEAMHAAGVNIFLECGPGKVLSGMIRRIVKDGRGIALETSEAMDEGASIVAAGG